MKVNQQGSCSFCALNSCYNELMFKSLKLTRRQQDILIGSILGDGCIYVGQGKNPCYYIKQCEKSKEYIFWLYKELENLCPSRPKQRSDNNQWYFYSSQSKILWPLREIFYPNGKKIVPEEIDKLLVSPISLAIWYMEDGTLDFRKKDHCAFSLTINCFTLDESELLSRALKNNFGIISTVQNPICRGKRYPKLYIGAKGRERFLNLIQPYIHKCFDYKLPQNRVSPSETDSVPPWCGRDRRYLLRKEKLNFYHTPSARSIK